MSGTPQAAGHAAGHSPHGHGDHGHTIVPLITLRLVLASLMFFTVLTVFLSRGEAWLSDIMNFDIPQWVNVVIALSIATVKTAIVVLFFMQLKYDNPLNAMIFIFTLLTVAFFLGFTMIDLGNRQTIDRFKGVSISPGGTGLSGEGPITVRAQEFARLEGHHHHHSVDRIERGGLTASGFRTPLPEIGSSPQFARPLKGLTLPGLAPVSAAGTADGHTADDH